MLGVPPLNRVAGPEVQATLVYLITLVSSSVAFYRFTTVTDLQGSPSSSLAVLSEFLLM